MPECLHCGTVLEITDWDAIHDEITSISHCPSCDARYTLYYTLCGIEKTDDE